MDIAALLRTMGGLGVVLGMLAAASFGTYLGRFLRWNSWDVLHHPFLLIDDVSGRFPSSPLVQTYLVLMFLFLLLSYCLLFTMAHLHLEEARYPAFQDG